MIAYKRVSNAIDTLRSEINAAHPGRSKISDGTLGDTAHAARKSDHNPDENGIVHAMDVTVWDDADADVQDDVAGPLAEHLRARRDPRTKYVIHRGQMFSSYGSTPWQWRDYDGPNGHFHHVHVSVYGDDGSTWGYPATTAPPEDIDMTKDELTQLLDLKLAPIKTDLVKAKADLAEVKRQVSKSEDANAKGGRTLRHIAASDLAKD
jgi:hypothetical protein